MPRFSPFGAAPFGVPSTFEPSPWSFLWEFSPLGPNAQVLSLCTVPLFLLGLDAAPPRFRVRRRFRGRPSAVLRPFGQGEPGLVATVSSRALWRLQQAAAQLREATEASERLIEASARAAGRAAGRGRAGGDQNERR